VLRRLSRGVRFEKFDVNEVLFVSEVIKLVFSIYMITGNSNNQKNAPLAKVLLDLIVKSKKMFILALIYGVGNILSYYALARVGAGTFVVFAQGKTLTTALFSALMLGRQYNWTKIRALLTLVGGVILFVIPTLDLSQNNHSLGEAVHGCMAQLVAVMLSGFASIYFEKAIKNDVATEGLDIWARNFQLGFYSILMYGSLLIGNPTVHYDSDRIFFAHWTPLACVISLMGACGGLLVALSIKYGDSVLKTLAISGSIIYAAIVDRFFLGGPLNGQMVISASIVVMAIISYTFDATPADASPGLMTDDSAKDKKLTPDEEEGSLAFNSDDDSTLCTTVSQPNSSTTLGSTESKERKRYTTRTSSS